MIPPALLLFFRNYWSYIAIGLVVIAYTGGVYYQGGVGPRAELAKERAEVEAETAKLVAAWQEDQDESDMYIAQLEEAHDQRVGRINTAWDAFIAGLPAGVHGNASGSPKPKPVPIAASVCNDAAVNQRLSLALSRYRDEVRDSIDQERSGRRSIAAGERAETSRLLKACELQTGDLIEVQDWAQKERQIHAPQP